MSGAPIPPLTDAQLHELFPLTPPKPVKDNAYEVALVLGGTVSAGAYTAGVLDYLIEALDAWTLAKHNHLAHAPTHELVLSTIAGASGGAVNGAIMTRAMGWAFPHGESAENPFYDIWVNRLQLTDLLSEEHDSDQTIAGGFSSFLNTSAFARMAAHIIGWSGQILGGGATPHARGYLTDPLRLFMTVTNLTGTPYFINFRGADHLGHHMRTHGDHVRFGLSVPGGAPNRKIERRDELALSTATDANWIFLKEMALATCAFPAAFPARPVRRRLESVAYRVALVPGEESDRPEHVQLIPNWTALDDPGAPPGFLRTVNVDGGAINNEPLDLAHIALAGLNGRNPRKGKDAHRGTILIDPFCEGKKSELFEPVGVLSLLPPLVGALLGQSRFRASDIALAAEESIFSRFLVAPSGPGPGGRGKIVGEEALTSGGLGAFLGFLNSDFLKYDFRLGRHNAHRFLRDHFTLPENNSIFDGIWNEDQKTAHMAGTIADPDSGETKRLLPLVPLMPALRDNPPPAPVAGDWPRGRANAEEWRGPVERRLNSVFNAMKAEFKAKGEWPSGFIVGNAINAAWSHFLRPLLGRKVIGTIAKALRDKDLT